MFTCLSGKVSAFMEPLVWWESEARDNGKTLRWGRQQIFTCGFMAKKGKAQPKSGAMLRASIQGISCHPLNTPTVSRNTVLRTQEHYSQFCLTADSFSFYTNGVPAHEMGVHRLALGQHVYCQHTHHTQPSLQLSPYWFLETNCGTLLSAPL